MQIIKNVYSMTWSMASSPLAHVGITLRCEIRDFGWQKIEQAWF
jgi:hypothetical protein